MEKIVLVVYLGIVSVFDCKDCKIPVFSVAVGMLLSVLGVIGRCLTYPDSLQWILLAALLGCVPGVVMLIVGWLSKRVGCGDGMILIAVGMLVGYRSCFVLLCGSLLLMSLFCIGLLLSKKGNRNTKIPYLPFLWAVYLVGLFI